MFTTEADRARPDWSLCREGAIHLFHERDALRNACAALSGVGYVVSTIACGSDRRVFYDEMSAVLRWEDFIGPGFGWNGNLDALNDVFYGFPFGPSGRAVLVLDDFGTLAAEDPRFAWHVLDIIGTRARTHLLEGHILLALLQSDDPSYEPDPIGGHVPTWNVRDWS